MKTLKMVQVKNILKKKKKSEVELLGARPQQGIGKIQLLVVGQ